jgi:hypothetical protein
VFQTATPYRETKFIIYSLKQEVYNSQKHRRVIEHNERKKVHTPTPPKTAQGKQLYTSIHDCSNNLGFNYSNNVTNGIS